MSDQKDSNQSFLDLKLPKAVGTDISQAGVVLYTLMRRLVYLARAFSALVLILCVLVFLGYIFDIPSLFRPISDGPATSPLTLVLASLLAVTQLMHRPLRRDTLWMDLVLGGVVLITLFRTGEIIFGEDILSLSTILDHLLPLQDGSMSARTGLNTLICAQLICVGFMLRRRWPRGGLAVAMMAPLPPMVALIGYLFALQSLHGQMSLMTVLLFLPLSGAMVVNYIHHRLLRPLVAESTLGRIARVQLFAGFFIPLGLGILFFHVPDAIYSPWAAVYVGAIIWFIATMVIVSAAAHEATDLRRRTVERKLVRLSMRDPLTGIVNRQGVADALPDIDRSSLGVMLLDLDFFKQVNDIHGHAVGDIILQLVGEALRARLRPDDIVARWGGEEFLVLAPGMQPDTLQRLSEDLRHCVTQVRKTSGVELTASVGATLMSGAHETLDDALARADTGLYMAKSKGRNMVVIRDQPNRPDGAIEAHKEQRASQFPLN